MNARDALSLMAPAFGISLVILGLVPAVRLLGASERLAFTGAGLLILVLWMLPWSVLEAVLASEAAGEFELFKTSSIFDSTAKNPDWLGQEPERIRALMPDG